MTALVLEINDLEIRVSDEDDTKFLSVGVANVSQGKTQFGEDAVKVGRLDPLNTYDHFWHRLDVEPFAKSIGDYRHNADFAFAHLMEMSEAALEDRDVVFAVPDSFTRHQYSVLLGIAQHCPFKVVGMVDSALLAASEEPSAQIIYVDLQLHQITFSRLARESGELRCQSNSQLHSLGWIEIAESLLQYINACFIQQSRFNPQHDAGSEQYLFDLLPECMARIDTIDSAQATDGVSHQTISVMHKGALHQIKIANEAIVARLHKVYEQIQQQVVSLDPSGSATVLLSQRVHRLPRIINALKSLNRPVKVATQNAVSRTCLDNLAAIKSGDTIQLITSLKMSEIDGEPQRDHAQVAPTHVLHGAQAIRLVVDMAIIKRDGKLQLVSAGKYETKEKLAGISEQDGRFFLVPVVAGTALNGKLVSSSVQLTVGDIISSSAVTGNIICIEVKDGNE